MADAVFTVYCPASGVRAIVGCACEDIGHDAVAAGAHHGRCQMNSLTANLSCTGPDGCCGDACEGGAHCEQVANSCEGGHDECPEPETCKINESAKAHHASMKAAHREHLQLASAGLADVSVRHAAEDLDEPPERCPGGHCHAGIPECKVHHPVIITAGLMSATLRPVTS